MHLLLIRLRLAQPVRDNTMKITNTKKCTIDKKARFSPLGWTHLSGQSSVDHILHMHHGHNNKLIPLILVVNAIISQAEEKYLKR